MLATDIGCTLFLQGGKPPTTTVAVPAVYSSVEFKRDLMAPVQDVLRDTLDHIFPGVQSEEHNVASILQQRLVQAQQNLERQAEPRTAIQQAWDVFTVFRSESQLGLSNRNRKSKNRTSAS